MDAGSSTSRSTKLAAELVSGWRSERPLVVVVARGDDGRRPRSFRNLDRTHVVEVGQLEVADLRLGAVADRVQGGAGGAGGR